MPQDHDQPLRDAATHWYDQHLGEHLHRDRALAAKRCAAHLLTQWATTPLRAMNIAMQVLGLVEHRACPAFVDMDHTTSHAVFLSDPASGRGFVLTASDLMYFVRISLAGIESAIAPIELPRAAAH